MLQVGWLGTAARSAHRLRATSSRRSPSTVYTPPEKSPGSGRATAFELDRDSTTPKPRQRSSAAASLATSRFNPSLADRLAAARPAGPARIDATVTGVDEDPQMAIAVRRREQHTRPRLKPGRGDRRRVGLQGRGRNQPQAFDGHARNTGALIWQPAHHEKLATAGPPFAKRNIRTNSPGTRPRSWQAARGSANGVTPIGCRFAAGASDCQ